MARSECEIRPVKNKLRNSKSGQDETPTLSRVSSLLPSIVNNNSIHIKTENIMQLSSAMMIVGNSLTKKKLRRLDGYLTIKNAVVIL